MCDECFGQRTLYRPLRDIEVTVKRTFYNFDKTLILDMEVDEIQTIGGIDACPKCARRAEDEYRGWHG